MEIIVLLVTIILAGTVSQWAATGAATGSAANPTNPIVGAQPDQRAVQYGQQAVAQEFLTSNEGLVPVPEAPSDIVYNACVLTDWATYLVNETVTISGLYFEPGTPVTVNVSRPCCCGQHAFHFDVLPDVVTDENGTFATYYANTWAIGCYNVTATDGVQEASNGFDVRTCRIWTDRLKYQPNETVTIFGSHFNPASTVNVTVWRPDNTTTAWQVLSDATGNFTTTYELVTTAGVYQVLATDGTNYAGTTFCDEYITLSTSHGLKGTWVYVTLHGFWGNAQAFFGGTGIWWSVGVKDTATFSYQIPDWATDGGVYSFYVESYGQREWWHTGPDESYCGCRIWFFVCLVPNTCYHPHLDPPRGYYTSALFHIDAKPIAEADGPYSVNVYQSLSFSGSLSRDIDGYITRYQWYFGDGSSAYGPNPTHAYANPGVYLAQLTVWDDMGYSSSDNAWVTIHNPPPIAVALGPGSAFTGQAVQFDGTRSYDPVGTITSYEWSFGDGSAPSSARAPLHSYYRSGTYTVRLTVTDNHGASSYDEITVEILAHLHVDPGGPYQGYAGEPVSFDGTGSYALIGFIVAYEWHFGDGTTASGATPSHTYAEPGVYYVELRVYDDQGFSDGAWAVVAIDVPPNTPVGNQVAVTDTATGVTVVFDSVTVRGTTTVTPRGTGPLAPAGYHLVATYFDISTTAIYSGPITVQIPYQESSLLYPAFEATLTLWQWNSALNIWQQITTGVNTADDDVSGETSQLLLLAIMEVSDVTPPTTSITPSGIQGLGGWYTTKVAVLIHATDDISGVAVSAYRIGDGPWLDYTGQFDIYLEGEQRLYYYSKDVAGNTELVKIESFWIDITDPVTTSSPSGVRDSSGNFITDVEVTLIGADLVSGYASTAYSFDGLTWNTYTGTIHVLGPGTTTVYYRSTDNAGNTEDAKTVVIRIGGTVNIWSDGSVDPSSAPLVVTGQTYTFSANIYATVNVYADNIVIDGKGYSLHLGASYGFRLSGRVGVTIRNVVLIGFSYGIWIRSSSHITFSDNVLAEIGSTGILLQTSAYTQICDNQILSFWEGISIQEASFSLVAGNTIAGSWYGICLQDPCTYNEITGNAFSNIGYFGMYLVWSIDYNTIAENTFTNCKVGIVGWEADANDIRYNTFESSTQFGIWFYNCSNNIIYGNRVASSAAEGLYIDSSNYNEIGWNTITANKIGLALYRSSIGNVIHHNLFVGNTWQTVVDASCSPNAWYDSVSLEGNFWSDYPGVDDGSGTGKHASAGDFIGDTQLPWHGDEYPFLLTTIQFSGTQGLGSWYCSDVTVTLASIDFLVIVEGVQYCFDGKTWQSYDAPFVITTEGVTTIYYRSLYLGGLLEQRRTACLKIDKTAPETKAALSGTGGGDDWYRSDVTVILTATDTTSGLAEIQYSLDGWTWTRYTASLTYSLEGITWVYYRSMDLAGNAEAIHSQAVKIDKTPPTTSISLSGTSQVPGWFVSDVTVTLSATDATSGIAGIQYSYDGATWLSYESPFTIAVEGYKRVYFQSSDIAGNTEIQKLEYINIDKTPPTTQLTITFYRIGEEGIIYVTTATTFALTADDQISGVTETCYRIDSGAWVHYSAPFALPPKSGMHTIYYRSLDVAGNEEPVKSIVVELVSLCLSSCLMDGDLNPITSFDFIVHYDKQLGLYQLVATNPGQFFYHIELQNDWSMAIDALLVQAMIPSDFVLKGATPIHVYIDDVDVTQLCVICDTTIQVTSLKVGSRLHIVIHLDYALKKQYFDSLQSISLRNYVFQVQAEATSGTPSEPGQGLVGLYSSQASLVGSQKQLTAIAGYVRNVAGTPVEGALIELLAADGTLVASTATDSDGFYYFLDLDPGQYTVSVTYEGSTDTSDLIPLTEHEVVVVTFTLDDIGQVP